MVTQTKETTHTFYFDMIGCNKLTLVPIERLESDIPENQREKVLEALKAGQKIKWPFNPPKEEAERLEREALCRVCKNNHLKLIWPMAGTSE